MAGKRGLSPNFSRHLSAATLARGYYPAIVTLWRWLDRPDEPPRPRITPTTLQEDTTS